MSGFPKTIFVKGVGVPVENWDELDELIQRYGGEVVIATAPPVSRSAANPSIPGFTPTDRALLERFIEEGSRGVLTSEITQLTGKQRKAIRPYLEGWTRKIGLVHDEGQTAFEQAKRFEGRAFRMTPPFLRVASQLLGRGTG